jgi:hypothetical protein
MRIGSAELIGYVLSWVSFPLLLLTGAKLLDRGTRIYGAVAIYNWLSVLYAGLQLPIEIANFYGLSDDLSSTLGIALLFFVTACEFFAFKRILEVRFEIALALVAVDFILSRVIVSLLFAMALKPLF